MLIGNYTSKFNAKGRTALPKKFSNELGNHLVLLQGYENCLMIVPQEDLQSFLPSNQPFAMSAARSADRFLLGNAFEVEPDSQGRFVIPQPLREYASLNHEELIFVGVGNRVEIWDPQSWEQQQQYLAENSATIAENLVTKNESK